MEKTLNSLKIWRLIAIIADENEREWGTQNWDEKSAEYIEKGFVPISMKQDFAVIYPEGITKAAEQYIPQQSQNDAVSKVAA